MKSVCIKTNNSQILDYLLEDLENLNLSDVYVSNTSFKVYNNIIIHYKGKDLVFFINCISSILANAIIIFYEKNLISNIIESEFFYFNNSEKETIRTLALSTNMSSVSNYCYNFNCIFNALSDYLLENKKLILSGFVAFRLKNYIDSLEKLVSCCVNKFIINREYQELIDIIKLYINSRCSSSKEFYEVHLIYINNKKTLLVDSLKRLISTTQKGFAEKIVSDISFSDNDYIFNSLIDISPQKLTIHLVNSEIDDFINTLQLIFEEKVNFCTDCNICEIYKLNSYNIDF